MSNPTASIWAAAAQLRWMVRLEHVRPTRFGEKQRAGLQWAVTPYLGRRPDGTLIGGFVPTYFPNMTKAHAYARAQMHRTYGGDRR
ncbi:hypothetical protein JNB63_02020 [Microbacterium trichothecenolyticum]|uniref:hypothetical protein n=1 Tax=Microbacterium trichothecenolyticum TaxID=69370 RepID=UPI001C6DE65E|nr:hypothetical protein [Microbacterium trichothecenolyticum]MBW9118862.1 hypothetical protein [Microbacterium trichothecenolyticum]